MAAASSKYRCTLIAGRNYSCRLPISAATIVTFINDFALVVIVLLRGLRWRSLELLAFIFDFADALATFAANVVRDFYELQNVLLWKSSMTGPRKQLKSGNLHIAGSPSRKRSNRFPRSRTPLHQSPL